MKYFRRFRTIFGTIKIAEKKRSIAAGFRAWIRLKLADFWKVKKIMSFQYFFWSKFKFKYRQ